MSAEDRIGEACVLLSALGFPPQQSNQRSALALLALLNLKPGDKWSDASSRLIGIAEIIDFANNFYATTYKTGSRETFRKHSLHQFVAAGLAHYNPDDPSRPVNSPDACYQIDDEALTLIRLYKTVPWAKAVAKYSVHRETLVQKYAKHREMTKVAVKMAAGTTITLSAGAHSDLIRRVIDDFAERFAPGARLLYVGDTGDKWVYFDKEAFAALGLNIDPHGKMPDVVLYDEQRDWLLLVEAVTSVGPMDGKRHSELNALFKDTESGLVFVTAFPDRSVFGRHLSDIAWETEVWVADQPSHLIHFNGVRFLGPYE